MWLNIAWRDYSLSWNESDYGGIKSIRVPPALLWKPDILMYNSADEDIDSTFPTNVVVSSTGDCLWVPPGLFQSTCKINILWFPFDDQNCTMKFGSWTYDSSGIDLQLQGEGGDVSSFIENGEWLLIGMPAIRNVVTYDCCPEQYIDITFTVHIRRRTLFYGFNLIIPCVLISSMALLTFTLPPEAGEKISLGVTILLSLTVFLLLVAEAMPPTSDALPLIGMYFACIMMMCSLSVVFTVLVLNYHHRSPNTHIMPTWVRKLICEWLAWLMRMQRPGNRMLSPAVRKRTIVERQASFSSVKVNGDSLASNTASVKVKRSSRSLLANVLDLNDDLTTIRSPPPPTSHSNSVSSATVTAKYNGIDHRRTGNTIAAGGIGSTPTTSRRPNGDCQPFVGSSRQPHCTVIVTPPTYRRAKKDYTNSGPRDESPSKTNPRTNPTVDSALADILKELRFLTNKMQSDEEEQSVCNDWKFAAMVIDRLCLIMFTLFTVASTFAILFSAPHVIA